MLTWIRGTFRIILAKGEAMVPRDGLVTEDGLWAIHLEGTHVTLTHTASGKMVTRFKSLAAADEMTRHLNSMDVGWVVRNPQLTDQQTSEILAVARSLRTT